MLLLQSTGLLVLTSSIAHAASWQWTASLYAPKELGAMSFPTSLFVDTERQRYYVIDTGNNRLLSYDREGNFLNAFLADGRFSTPSFMTRQGEDTLWVVEKGKNSLSRIGLKSRDFESHTLSDEGLMVVPGKIIRHNGSLFLLDRSSGHVLKLDSDLSVQARFAVDQIDGFIDFTINGDSLLALARNPNRFYRFPLAGGNATATALTEPMTMPTALAVDDTGRIYILDRLQSDIAVFGPDGRFAYRFLGLGQGQGKLSYPTQIDFDPWGRLCIVDQGNGRVEIFGR